MGIGAKKTSRVVEAFYFVSSLVWILAIFILLNEGVNGIVKTTSLIIAIVLAIPTVYLLFLRKKKQISIIGFHKVNAFSGPTAIIIILISMFFGVGEYSKLSLYFFIFLVVVSLINIVRYLLWKKGKIQKTISKKKKKHSLKSYTKYYWSYWIVVVMVIVVIKLVFFVGVDEDTAFSLLLPYFFFVLVPPMLFYAFELRRTFMNEKMIYGDFSPVKGYGFSFESWTKMMKLWSKYPNLLEVYIISIVNFVTFLPFVLFLILF